MGRSDETFHVPEVTLGEPGQRERSPQRGKAVRDRDAENARSEGLGMVLAIGVLILADMAVVGALLWNQANVGYLLLPIFALPVVLVWLIMRLIWWPCRRRFPARPVRPGAEHRTFQSARVGLFGGFNNCLVIQSDDEHVHLSLMPPFSALAPGRVSIPRSALASFERRKFVNDMLVGRAEGVRLALPAWVGRGGAGESTRATTERVA